FRALGVHILSAIGSIPMTTAGTGHRIDPKRRGDGLYSTMGAGHLSTVSAGLGFPAAHGVRPGPIGAAAAAPSAWRRYRPTEASSTCATNRNIGFSAGLKTFSPPT